MLVQLLEENSSDALLSCWTASYALFHISLLCHLSQVMNLPVMGQMATVDTVAVRRKLGRVSILLKSSCFIFRGLEGLFLLYDSIINPGQAHELVSLTTGVFSPATVNLTMHEGRKISTGSGERDNEEHCPASCQPHK